MDQYSSYLGLCSAVLMAYVFFLCFACEIGFHLAWALNLLYS